MQNIFQWLERFCLGGNSTRLIMNTNTICMGTCCVNPYPWGPITPLVPYQGPARSCDPFPDQPYVINMFSSPVCLTEEEKDTLKSLSEAFEKFKQLEGTLDDEFKEFQLAIHAAQRIIATRVARRANPEVWRNE
jgi:hypothetical protein